MMTKAEKKVRRAMMNLTKAMVEFCEEQGVGNGIGWSACCHPHENELDYYNIFSDKDSNNDRTDYTFYKEK